MRTNPETTSTIRVQKGDFLFWLATWDRHSCRCRGSGDQTGRHNGHRCGSAWLGVACETILCLNHTYHNANIGLEYSDMLCLRSIIVDLLWSVKVNVLNLTERQVWQRRRMSGPASSEAFAANKRDQHISNSKQQHSYMNVVVYQHFNYVSPLWLFHSS